MAVVAASSTGTRTISVSCAGIRRLDFSKSFHLSVRKFEAVWPPNNEEKERAFASVHRNLGVSNLGASFNKLGLATRVHGFNNSTSASNIYSSYSKPLDEERVCRHKREFGCFIAREVLHHDEYWTAAWLRAEIFWEDHSQVRYVEYCKKELARQHFYSLKEKCSRQHPAKCICIVTVKKDKKDVKQPALNNIVGTMDLNIKYLFRGESFPGNYMKPPPFPTYQVDQPRYGYVSNLCVSKYARRQGIASNMLLLALKAATSYGVNEIFLHVYKDNIAARKLYDRIGFQIVETASTCSVENKYLLCLRA